MEFLSALMLGIGLSMDAFAVSMCCGASLRAHKMKVAIKLGIAFGFFQGFMPLIGYWIGDLFKAKIEAFDHWVAFILLAIIGGKMLFEALKEDSCGSSFEINKIWVLLGLSVATSIDALIAGLALPSLNMSPYLAVVIIGITTALFSFSGVYLGEKFCCKWGKKAEIFGALVLIGLGIKTLLEHLSSN